MGTCFQVSSGTDKYRVRINLYYMLFIFDRVD